MSVLVQTSVGNLVIDLETVKARKESLNFIKACKSKYFNFAPLYNIQNDFIVESGAPLYPLSKDGSSIWHQIDKSNPRNFEVSPNGIKANIKGAVSYITQICEGALFASSIFTITLKDLDASVKSLSRNVVFGHVVEGMDVLERINSTIVDQNYRPLQDIRIHHVYVLDDPFDDPEGMIVPDRSPEPTWEQLSTVRIDDIEDLNLNEDDDKEDAEAIKRKKQAEAESKALTLELIGDLPSAEVKPMENVLFVCKLNPLTNDEDLKIIFSRFGRIVSCEVIRDSKTGDSLQYAFVEFETKESCEKAYFKMDGVLIDDRRIHVDFSQSVSKLTESWRNRANKQRTERNERKRVNQESGKQQSSNYKKNRNNSTKDV